MVAPDRGQLVWLDFNPTRGHEQKHHRPALVLSPKKYNHKSGLVLVCPITSHVKGYPFEVPITHTKINGAILTDQVRSVDWKARKAKRIGTCDADVLKEVIGKLHLLLS